MVDCFTVEGLEEERSLMIVKRKGVFWETGVQRMHVDAHCWEMSDVSDNRPGCGWTGGWPQRVFVLSVAASASVMLYQRGICCSLTLQNQHSRSIC